MRSTTLTLLLARLRWRADIVSETSRHTDAELTIEINSAIVELRGRLTQDGSELYLTYASGTLTTTPAAAGENYVSITAPTAAEQILAIDIVDNDNLIRLEHTPLEQRLLGGSNVLDGQYPSGWGLLDIDTREVAIYPIPDEAYQYILWYQKQHTDLSAGSDTVTLLPGFEDYIVWRAAHMIAVRDEIPRLAQDAERLAEQSYAVALRAATRVARPDHHRKDTRSGGRLTAAGRMRAQ